MAGYSGTPLSTKLGIKPGHAVHTIDAPAGYRALLAPLPDDVTFVARLSDSVDVVHVFVTNASTLAAALPRIRERMRPDASVWVSWPKKAASRSRRSSAFATATADKSDRLETDVTEDVVRAVALPTGLVDVKVCAVDDVWSGLKLVVRKALRETATARPRRTTR
jgi:prophage DNA circulation protein